MCSTRTGRSGCSESASSSPRSSGSGSTSGASAGSRAGSAVLAVAGDPVAGDEELGGGECHLMCADPLAEAAGELVLEVGDRSRVGPQIARIVERAAELERDQVV